MEKLAASDLHFISQSTVYPYRPSSLELLKLSVSDLPMLSCHYIQKGLLFPPPPIPTQTLVSTLRFSLSHALTRFPALAGRFVTDPLDSRIFISCDDSGVPVSHYCVAASAAATALSLPGILLSETITGDVPQSVRSLFDFSGVVSYDGHYRPLAAVRVTELSDGSLFIGCSVNHALCDGTSFWNFFNSWAEICRSGSPDIILLTNEPDFSRNFFSHSTSVLRLPGGKTPEVTFPVNAPLRERIFHFTGDTIRDLKSKVNSISDHYNSLEIFGKLSNDKKKMLNIISSFQSLCALLWKHVTRARKLPAGATTTFRMAVNCRHRLVPPVDSHYFGNAIQSIPTEAGAEEVCLKDLRWSAGLLRARVAAYGDGAVRKAVEGWERAPRCFPLGNPSGTGLTMGSSPRFPMYDNDFGWGKPVAVRSGMANKFDGKMSAFPGKEGNGSVDIEVCLAPATMTALLLDAEFMAFVSSQ